MGLPALQLVPCLSGSSWVESGMSAALYINILGLYGIVPLCAIYLPIILSLLSGLEHI